MSLNITVATPRCIYQSADYRLLDLETGRSFDFETQKVVLVNGYRWSATVCFAGVGRTRDVDVGEWLARRTAALDPDAPFERLLDELRTADIWLAAVAAPHNRHSFSVGAFVGSKPTFALVSNYEQPSGLVADIASGALSVFTLRPTKPIVFVSGQRGAVSRAERRRLAALAAQDPEPQRMYSALEEVNRDAAKRSPLVSPACYTTHVHLIGGGGGAVHGIGSRPFLPTFLIPEGIRVPITRLINEKFGLGRAQAVSVSMTRADASDEYHEIQVREKPNDPTVHSNYGVFLTERKHDFEGAEREYRRALELDPNHVNALGNLANLLVERGDRDQAASLYRQALTVDPGNENVTWNYARLLLIGFDDRQAARDVLDRAIAAHPESGRLLLLTAQLTPLDRSAMEALEGFRRARERGADQVAVEAGYATALHASNAPIGECIAAYRVAIGLNPRDGVLRLNLAQLLFIIAEDREANSQLHEAMRLGLDASAQLEVQFYLLAHTSSEPAAAFRTTKALLAQGARLHWNVESNVSRIRRSDPHKADLLEHIAKIMAGDLSQAVLDQVLERWK